MTEPTKHMQDIVGRQLAVGDIIAIPSAYNGTVGIYIIKHFSSCGIFGFRLTPYSYSSKDTIQDRVDARLSTNSIYLESRFSKYRWGGKYSFSNRVVKINLEDIPLKESSYQRLLEEMGVEKKEYEPTGTVKI